MRKSEIDAMLGVLKEYCEPYGFYQETHDKRAKVVYIGVTAIRQAMEAAGVDKDLIRDYCVASYATGAERAKEMSR